MIGLSYFWTCRSSSAATPVPWCCHPWALQEGLQDQQAWQHVMQNLPGSGTRAAHPPQPVQQQQPVQQPQPEDPNAGKPPCTGLSWKGRNAVCHAPYAGPAMLEVPVASAPQPELSAQQQQSAAISGNAADPFGLDALIQVMGVGVKPARLSAFRPKTSTASLWL